MSWTYLPVTTNIDHNVQKQIRSTGPGPSPHFDIALLLLASDQKLIAALSITALPMPNPKSSVINRKKRDSQPSETYPAAKPNSVENEWFTHTISNNKIRINYPLFFFIKIWYKLIFSPSNLKFSLKFFNKKIYQFNSSNVTNKTWHPIF